jgi:hypothetical protein
MAAGKISGACLFPGNKLEWLPGMCSDYPFQNIIGEKEYK